MPMKDRDDMAVMDMNVEAYEEAAERFDEVDPLDEALARLDGKMAEYFAEKYAAKPGEDSMDVLNRLLEEGRRDVEEGRTYPHKEVMAEMRRRLADGTI